MGMRELRFPDSRTAVTAAPESSEGDVFGIITRPVIPPLMADSEPVAMFSLCSWPGSRRWTWASKKAGQRIWFLQSMTFALSVAVIPLATFCITPSMIRTSAETRTGEDSEAMRALRRRRFTGGDGKFQIPNLKAQIQVSGNEMLGPRGEYE